MNLTTGYVSTGPAARRLGVSQATVSKFCVTGKLSNVETPIGRLIERTSLERLVVEREAVAPSRASLRRAALK